MYISEDNPKIQVEVIHIGTEYTKNPFVVLKFVNTNHNTYTAIAYTFDNFKSIEDILDKFSIAVQALKDSLKEESQEKQE